MTKRMLIDATHAEETRVAVVSGNRLDEFDFENTVRKQLKSNIYLVKVTRVEPSLQAAFVDFGGNRHGFLPFPEIHPDYYRIPVSDREALIEAEQQAIAAEEAEREKREEARNKAQEEKAAKAKAKTKKTKAAKKEDDAEQVVSENVEELEEGKSAHKKETASDAEEILKSNETDESEDDAEDTDTIDVDEDDAVDEDITETPRRRKTHIKQRYKIQEVIKRNQIMLIQINKEERGNKGAAVSTYISLPGRYCVLMPNSPRGGGVSRKVSNMKDRQYLKKTLAEIGVPKGMSVILRTAGVSRSKAEIKRDLDYLLRMWDKIREETLKSSAPALIYEEGNLIKRSIRDLYRRDIDEILVAGEEGYRTAKDFMKTLMPSHTKKVQEYKDETMPLFFRYKVENQIDETYDPVAQMPSGGYIVINPTEALISIDVNSGKATKGRHIEETALKTNLEAADEIARQLRLRDFGGLVVIDFIDMEEHKNNRQVERRLKDAMQTDRARIQIGRISTFGLLEMSRQRLRPSLVEQNSELCKHCNATGTIRTIETASVVILRQLEEEGLRKRANEICLSVPTEIALYIFNSKREMLSDIEARNNMKISIKADESMIRTDYKIEIIKPRPGAKQPAAQKGPYKKEGQKDNKNRRPQRRRKNPRHNNNNPNKEPVKASDTPIDQKAQDNKPSLESTEAPKNEAPQAVSEAKDIKPTEEKKKPQKKAAPKDKKVSDDKKEAVKKDNIKKEKAKPVKKAAPRKKKEASSDVVDIKAVKKDSPEAASKGSESKSDDPKKTRKGWWKRLKE